MVAQEARQLSLGQSTNSPLEYIRRDPEQTLLYQTIRENWQTFHAQAESSGKGLPFYVIREFESFLQCGVLASGFVRLKCEHCRHEKLVAFSCKKRGFCPSCGGRRMAETGVFLSEMVFPRVPIRQWVLSVPIPLRYWMAANPRLMGAVLGVVSRAISGFYRARAATRGSSGGETGAVTLIQRFGGSVNVNVHFHQLWVEGVFVEDGPDDPPRYRWVPKPTDEDVAGLLSVIRARVVRLLVKRGYIEADERSTGEATEGLESNEPLLAAMMAASTQGCITIGDRAGQRVRRVGSWGLPSEKPELTGPLCVSLGGFSLHANAFIETGKPAKLEKLCRYVSRPPVAEHRLYRIENGDIGYMLKSQWNDGTFAVQFSPLEFIEKLVALIPPPRIHMTRYHGVLAPHHSWRDEIVPTTSGELAKNKDAKTPNRRRMSWAELLKRVFKIDLTTCPDCGGTVRFIAAVMKREVVVKILNHLKLPTAVPGWVPARAPPAQAFDF